MQPEREDEGALYTSYLKAGDTRGKPDPELGCQDIDKENINSVGHLGPGHARTGSVLFISSPITLNVKQDEFLKHES